MRGLEDYGVYIGDDLVWLAVCFAVWATVWSPGGC